VSRFTALSPVTKSQTWTWTVSTLGALVAIGTVAVLRGRRFCPRCAMIAAVAGSWLAARFARQA